MTHSFPVLADLLILLVASIPIAFLCNRLRMPAIIGFMITGVLIGPFSLGLIRDQKAVEVLAEIGVVLLLFTIGLEFSLREIVQMKRVVLGGGGLQVGLTVLVAAGVVYWMDRSVSRALLFGFLFSLSSTAIVLKSYLERAEIDAPHGRAGVGILLFQDLCVVPMMLAIPILSGQQGRTPAHLALTLGTAMGAVVLIIIAARILVPRALSRIVGLRSPEVFIIFVVLVCLGTSWLTAQLGLSLALGAFIAGLVLSESEHSHQIVADILPFRDVFNSIFFISIGMLLSVGFVVVHATAIIGWVAALMVGKAAIAIAALRVMGYPLRISVTTAVGIAQVGEFSFILAKAASAQGLVSEGDSQTFLAASILSMMATPFLIRVAPRIGYGLQALMTLGSAPLPGLQCDEPAEPRLIGHVVVVGYGMNGRNVAKVLKRVEAAYVVLELNGETVREAKSQGESILFGDATRREVLHQTGLEHARLLVIAISDAIATRRAIAAAREMNPHLHIIVRTRYVSEVPGLYSLGADEVIPEEFETSLQIVSRVLREYGIGRHTIELELETIRDEGYQILRLPPDQAGPTGRIGRALASASTESLVLETGFLAIGKSIAELDLRRVTGATIAVAMREGESYVNPDPQFHFQAGDVVVLLGSPEEIARAAELLAQPATNSPAPEP